MNKVLIEIAEHKDTKQLGILVTNMADGEPGFVGEIKTTGECMLFTCDGMDVWLTPAILRGIAQLLEQAYDSLNTHNESGVVH